MWVGASQRNSIVLEETTKAFISVGNNRLQSCLPSTGMNLKNLEKETVNWTNHNKAYNNNNHAKKKKKKHQAFDSDLLHNNTVYELVFLGIEMSLWIWSLSDETKWLNLIRVAYTHIISPSLWFHICKIKCSFRFPPAVIKNKPYFSNLVISCILFTLSSLESIIGYLCAECDERITIRGRPDAAGPSYLITSLWRYFYISIHIAGLGMSLFKNKTHPSNFYILCNLSWASLHR